MKIIDNVKKKIRQTKFSVIKTVVTKANDERVLSFAADKGDSLVRMHLATNPNLTKAIIEKLKNDKSVFVRCQVANNKLTTSDILEELAFDPNQKVRKAVAEREDCKEKTLEKLSNDPNSEVIGNLVNNKSINSKVMTSLSVTTNKYILRCLTKNEKLPSEVLYDIVCNNPDYGMRFNIARHPNINSDIVFKLMETYDPDQSQVANALLENPNVSEDEKGMITITTGMSLEEDDEELSKIEDDET